MASLEAFRYFQRRLLSPSIGFWFEQAFGLLSYLDSFAAIFNIHNGFSRSLFSLQTSPADFNGFP